MTDRPDETWDDPATEQIVADAFAAFRDAQRGTAVPPEIDTVYAAAATQRRRKAYLSGLAAAAALVLVTGTAALLSVLDDPAPAPIADAPPSPSESPSPTPPASQSARPEPEKPVATSAAPPPSIRDIDLRNTTVTVRSLDDGSCPGGNLGFRGGEATGPNNCVWRIASGGVRYADLDGVAGQEAVTTIASGPPNAEFLTAVIAFRLDGKTVRAMDFVYVAEHSSQQITGISVAQDGTITVGIEDSTWDPEQPQRQDRTYRWTGSSAFAQIAGPTAFPSPEPPPASPDPSGSPAGD